MTSSAAPQDFPIEDTVGAWVPHGRFIIPPTHSGPLDGLRFGVKDLFDVAGHPTGAGNPTWLTTHPVPTDSSPIVRTLLEAGARLVGKLLTDELAYSINGDNRHYGTPINAAAPGHVPGGSSSGSAAAVAAGLCDFALGSDTGGSTRVPASYCGLWGLRTSHGLLSTEHMVPLHPSFDTATWLARDSGVFERVGDVLLPRADFHPTRLVLPAETWALADRAFHAPLEAVARAAGDLFGAIPESVRLTEARDTLDDWRKSYVAAGAHEAWKIHGDWIVRHQPAFSDPIAARWQAAAQVSDAQAADAWDHLAAVKARILETIDAQTIAIMPSAAGTAPALDAAGSAVDAVRMRTLQMTCVAGIAGLCQVSIPFVSESGLPVGISLVGPAGSDHALIGYAVQIADKLSARIGSN